MRQLVKTMFICNNRPSFHQCCKKNLVKHQKVSKYNVTDCRSSLNLHDISVAPKIVKKAIRNVDSLKASGSDCFSVVF